MAQEVSPLSEMAQARQSDGINVIFDQRSPGSSRLKSRSRSGSRSSNCSSRASRSRGRGAHRGRYRSSSSTSSSSSSSSSNRSTLRSSRSRSHPRCHRHSSRCRCRDHHRYRRRCQRSPLRRYRAHSRSYSRSPSLDHYYHRRRYRPRSRSPSSSRSRYSYSRVDRYRCQFSRSPPRSFRGRSRSRSPERSVGLSLEEKRQLLEAARENAMKILGVQRLELPESVKPMLTDHGVAGPETRVRRDSENSTSQSGVQQDASSPKLSPKKGMISFSSNNSVAKPTVSSLPSVKVTSLVDSIESKKSYGHWIPVKSAR